MRVRLGKDGMYLEVWFEKVEVRLREDRSI